MRIPVTTPQKPNLWDRLTLDEVKELLTFSVAECRRAHELLEEDERLAAEDPYRGRNYRLRLLVKGWEAVQDAHWAWYQEKLNAESTKGLGSQRN
ncbi:hypothetical protein J4U01_gp011 [Mycobacterium phage Kumao]|uniref:Uncharacterized protein n=1 Tax=Mycobacterium phage Kumao TaxID=2041344 RepID=A0A2D1GPQ3_9CAUD|nr:hypothetical protein J4U01_gp011 [Mycobacterium phage Kumao]ATN93974.1 hypothetical protein SEA_KUMAO_11 [Mycobacterium phage Kumao]